VRAGSSRGPTIRTFVLALTLAFSMGLPACAVPTPAATSQPAAATTQAGQTHIDAAKAALKAGKYDDALKEAQLAITIDGQNSEAHYLLGNAYNQLAGIETDGPKRQDDLTKAVDEYMKAINLDPKNDAAFTNLATVYYQNGQFDEAEKQVNLALKLNPTDPTSHYVLGTIYLQRDPTKVTDALDKAQAEFEAALKSDPKMGAAYIGLANVYLFRKDYARALDNAQKGVDLTQDAPSPFAYWALAQAQCANGDKAGGAKSIDKINSFNPTDPFFKQQVQALANQCK
jgi:Flp pilus assembly protein TadD